MMAVPISQLNRLRTANRVLSNNIESDMRQVFRGLDLSRPEMARDALLEVSPAIATTRSQQSAVAAAEWYEEVRRAEVGGSYTARLGELPQTDWIQQDVRWAVDSLFLDLPSKTISDLTEAIVRKALFASQDTINKNTVIHDTAAAGWQRVAHPGGCDFCVMLAQRGAVYKRDTADFASHNNCRCRARPSWDDSLPEVEVMAYEASERTARLRQRANDPNLTDAQRAGYARELRARKLRVDEWIRSNESQMDGFRQAMENLT